MTGFQAEENLTGRAPKKCAKNSGRYHEIPKSGIFICKTPLLDIFRGKNFRIWLAFSAESGL